MTVSAMFIFCFIVAEHATRAWHCLVTLAVVVLNCVFHLSDGARFIPKYVYSSCWCKTCRGWFLLLILVAWMGALKTMGWSFDLFGQPVTAHSEIPRSIPAQLQNLSSLLSCACNDSSLLAIAARSSA